VTESTIQWVLYERLKKLGIAVDGQNGISQWLGMLGSAGSAKFVATVITYPHEVLLSPSFFPKVHLRILISIGDSNSTSTTKC
jgi:solute carrier family 25 protein 33/36